MDNQEQTHSLPTQSEVPIPSPTSGKPWIKWVVVVAIVALISSAVTFFAVTQNKTKQQEVQPTTINKPSSIPTTATQSSETANWKTYTNDSLKYSIKYPTDNYIRLICPGEEFILAKRSRGYANNADPMEMQTCARDGRFDVEIITPLGFVDEPKSDSNYDVVKEEIIVAGVKARKYTATLINKNPSPLPEWYMEVFVDHNNRLHRIYLGDKGSLAVFNQMLSTFTFIQ